MVFAVSWLMIKSCFRCGVELFLRTGAWITEAQRNVLRIRGIRPGYDYSAVRLYRWPDPVCMQREVLFFLNRTENRLQRSGIVLSRRLSINIRKIAYRAINRFRLLCCSDGRSFFGAEMQHPVCPAPLQVYGFRFNRTSIRI